MVEDAVLPIREFSRLTGISRETLRFYDKIALLSPDVRGKHNGYRYYSPRQLDFAFLISELRALGMGLEEIKRYADGRTPEKMLALLREQTAHIEAEIQRLRSIQAVMALRAQAAEEALRHEEGTVVWEERAREPIFLCPPPAEGSTDLEASVQAYRYAMEHGVSMNCPAGVRFPAADLETGSQSAPPRMYFKVWKGHNAWKAAGCYAVYHCRPGSGAESVPYQPLLSRIRGKGLRMEGDAYVEYPLDELAAHSWEAYRIRMEVRVVPKEPSPSDGGAAECRTPPEVF